MKNARGETWKRELKGRTRKTRRQTERREIRRQLQTLNEEMGR